MSQDRSGDVTLIDVGETLGAFHRLRDAAIGAVDDGARRVVIDLSAVDPVDGAMLGLLSRLRDALGPSARIAVVAAPEAAQQFAEWRLDTLWPVTSDRDTAQRVLSQ